MNKFDWKYMLELIGWGIAISSLIPSIVYAILVEKLTTIAEKGRYDWLNWLTIGMAFGGLSFALLVRINRTESWLKDNCLVKDCAVEHE